MAAQGASHYLPLQGKTAIVTGGSRGIGAGIAFELARLGSDVVIIRRAVHASLTELITQIGALPHSPNVLSICGELEKETAAQEIVSGVAEWFKSRGEECKIDIVVNNAGVECVKPLAEITIEDFSHVYNVNVRGAVLMMQAVLPYLPAGGRIINISSVGARHGFKNLSLYCSSKAALEALTRCWASELGESGTTVNAVAPGPVQTPMLDNIPKQLVEMQKMMTPLEHRAGTVEEIASVVAWLAGDEAKWVTGQTINTSGGWTMY